MKKEPIWVKDKEVVRYKAIDSNLKTDILIIGGGIAGISVAYHLQSEEKNITLIDKGTIGLGATARTTAKLTYLQDLIYHQLEKRYCFDTAKQYLASQQEAIAIVKEQIKKHQLECDFEDTDSYVFSSEDYDQKSFDKEIAILKQLNVNVQKTKTIPIDFPCQTGIRVKNTAVFHPIKYIDQLTKQLSNVSIYEGVLAKQITEQGNNFEVETDKGMIIANQIVICTHYPFFIKPGWTPFKTYMKRSYVVASKIDKPLPMTAIHHSKPLHSFRFHQNYLLYGNTEHRLSSKLDYQANYEQVINLHHEYFQDKADYLWMNQDVMTQDQLPFIGQLQPNIYVATGFNGWGMTNGVIAGKVISDLIITGVSPYQTLFNPKRSMPVLNFLIDMVHITKVYAQTMLNKNYRYDKEKVYIKKGVATYVDSKERTHQVCATCPHMKCHLIFNGHEKTWDCPCHGSRFTLDGDILEGPSKDSIRIT